MKIKIFSFLVVALSMGIIAFGAGSLLADDHSVGAIKKDCEEVYHYCEHDCKREFAHGALKDCVDVCRKARKECEKV